MEENDHHQFAQGPTANAVHDLFGDHDENANDPFAQLQDDEPPADLLANDTKPVLSKPTPPAPTGGEVAQDPFEEIGNAHDGLASTSFHRPGETDQQQPMAVNGHIEKGDSPVEFTFTPFDRASAIDAGHKDFSDLLAEFEAEQADDDANLHGDSAPLAAPDSFQTTIPRSSDELSAPIELDKTPQLSGQSVFPAPIATPAGLFEDHSQGSSFDNLLAPDTAVASHPKTSHESATTDLDGSYQQGRPAPAQNGDTSMQSLFSDNSDWLADTSVDDSMDIRNKIDQNNNQNGTKESKRQPDEPLDFEVPQGWFDDQGNWKWYTDEQREHVRQTMYAQSPWLGDLPDEKQPPCELSGLRDYRKLTHPVPSPGLAVSSENAARRTPVPDRNPYEQSLSSNPNTPPSQPQTATTTSSYDPQTSSTETSYGGQSSYSQSPTQPASFNPFPVDPYAPQPQSRPYGPSGQGRPAMQSYAAPAPYSTGSSYTSPLAPPAGPSFIEKARPIAPPRMPSTAYDPPMLKTQRKVTRAASTMSLTGSGLSGFGGSSNESTQPPPVPPLPAAPPPGPPRHAKTPKQESTMPNFAPMPTNGQPVQQHPPRSLSPSGQELSREGGDYQYSQNDQSVPLLPLPMNQYAQEAQTGGSSLGPVHASSGSAPPQRPASSAGAARAPSYASFDPPIRPASSSRARNDQRPSESSFSAVNASGWSPLQNHTENETVQNESVQHFQGEDNRPLGQRDPSQMLSPPLPDRASSPYDSLSQPPRAGSRGSLRQKSPMFAAKPPFEARPPSQRGVHSNSNIISPRTVPAGPAPGWDPTPSMHPSRAQAAPAVGNGDMQYPSEQGALGLHTGQFEHTNPSSIRPEASYSGTFDQHSNLIQNATSPPFNEYTPPVAPLNGSDPHHSSHEPSYSPYQPSGHRQSLSNYSPDEQRRPHAQSGYLPETRQPPGIPDSTHGSDAYAPASYAPQGAMYGGSDSYVPHNAAYGHNGPSVDLSRGFSPPAPNPFQAMTAEQTHTYTPQQVLEQRPVSEDPLGRATIIARNRPLAIFGFGGRLITAFPGLAEDNAFGGANDGRTPAYGYASGRGRLSLRSLEELSSASALRSSEAAFPGPLLLDPSAVKGSAAEKKKREAILSYLEARADEIDKGLPYLKTSANQSRREEEGKVVLVRLLMAMIRGNGKFLGR